MSRAIYVNQSSICFQIFDGLGNGLSVGIAIKDVGAVGVDEEEAGLLQGDRALEHVHCRGAALSPRASLSASARSTGWAPRQKLYKGRNNFPNNTRQIKGGMNKRGLSSNPCTKDPRI